MPDINLYIPDGLATEAAIQRTTHLGIGAHQDDLEFMALHGILQGYQKQDVWFGGITCTDGAGSSRTGPYVDYSDEQMKAVRIEEQKTAANIGQYSFMAQLGHPSSHAKDPGKRDALRDDIRALLTQARPDVIYTHNPFDKHATHVGVLLAVLGAIRSLPESDRPRVIFGCEVWRGLDWLPDASKVLHNVSAHPNLAAALNGVFDSQITGGKRYDLAVEGRRLSNATFLDAHAIDQGDRIAYAIDLSELADPSASIESFTERHLSELKNEITTQLKALQ